MTTSTNATSTVRRNYRDECAYRRALGLVVTGRTFPVRERIKAMGGYWDAVLQGWLMPNHEMFEKADALANPSKSGKAPRQVQAPVIAAPTPEYVPAPVPVSTDEDMPF